MLHRQEMPGLDPDQANGLHFFNSLLLGHLVQRLDGYSWVLAPILDEENLATRAKRPDDAAHHLIGISKLVVSVDQQDGIERERRSLRESSSGDRVGDVSVDTLLAGGRRVTSEEAVGRSSRGV